MDKAELKRHRRVNREIALADLREGRRNRAVTFRSKKGAGSYRRKTKHGGFS